jgi:TRAP-type uncharacterized transport system substrate-binding protein
MVRATVVAGSFVTLLLATPTMAAAASLTRAGINNGVVELEIMGAGDISAQIGEDLANVVDDGATRRVLAIMGKGSLQNLIDLVALRGIDMAILQVDVLDYAKQQNLFPGVERSISYIAKLYNEEFHLLARRGINSVADLANQVVNVDVPGAGSGVTALRVFQLLNIPVTLTNNDQRVAIERLRKGDIAAVAFVAGRPAPLFRGLDGSDGLHFLNIPLNSAITATFIPTRLKAEDYPGLVSRDAPIDTVAVGTVLAAANLPPGSDRYRNIVTFVEAFFTGFPSLIEPGHHPKWREVNLFAEFPGWQRFPPAEQWLLRNAPVSGVSGPQDLQTIFSRFIDDRQKAGGGPALSEQEKNELFKQFQRWQTGQAR